MRTLNQPNKGNALVTALFIMALIAIMSTSIMQHLKINIIRTGQFIQAHELYLAAQLVPFWTMSTLSTMNDLPNSFNEAGQVMQFPAKLALLYPNIRVTGGLYDLQSRFNLNSLTNINMQIVFTKLLKQESQNLSGSFINLLMSATLDWITPNNAPNAQDKWSQYYQHLNPAYLPAHQLMQSVFEFNMVAGMNKALFQTLFPLISTLPESTPININTAPRALLQALSQVEDETALTQFLAARKEKGVLSAQAFSEAVKKLKLQPATVSNQSNYFLSIAVATHGKQSMTLYTVFKRTKNKISNAATTPNWKITLIRQSINTP